MPALYVLHHSPWSERARWALEHHGIAFEEREHVPLLGEIPLRIRRGALGGRLTVPLWIDDDGAAVEGSRAIAEYAESRGSGAPLFPAGSHERIAALDLELEDALDAARARFVHALPSAREACLESLPPALRGLPFAVASARLGATFVARKYAAASAGAEERMRSGLLRVREALAGRPYVLDDFSFADILGASVLQTMAPADDAFLSIPPATRALWQHEALASEFADLVAWRDRLYATHRRVAGARAA